MKLLIIMILLTLSACVNTTQERQWGQYTYTTKVASVHNIKSLVRPGIY